MKKKLQVFVSSTYTDLIEERQAAVQAILDAGHIPAGMELFKAGNESQLKTIYKWIDESDVYMLILGGRYGSIDSKSGKSYTQLEYEYALNKNIPVFAVVLNETFLTTKINLLGYTNATEQTAPDKHKEFKALVMSKIIREVEDCKDIKIAIHSTLNEFLNDYDLIGWVRNDAENDTTQLLKENNTLVKENLSLSKKVQKLQEQLDSKSKIQFGNYSFDELVNTLKSKEFILPEKFTHNEKIAINALKLFVFYFDDFTTGITNRNSSPDDTIYLYHRIAPYFISFGLLEHVKLTGTTAQRIQTTKLGASFYAMLEVKGMTGTK